MMRSRSQTQSALLALFVVLLGWTSSCSDDPPNQALDPCNDVDCSGHGQCQVQPDRTALCVCDEGFEGGEAGLSCVAVSDPCQGIDCNLGGACVVQAGAALCNCGSGYLRVDATTCVPELDPCFGVDCDAHGSCAVSAGLASCLCDPGYVQAAGAVTRCVFEQCESDCVGALCGDDGCLGVCGECAQDEFCDLDRQCQPRGSNCPADADCSTQSCGPDPVCGTSCGSCTAYPNSGCSSAGECACLPFAGCVEALSAASVECGMVSDGCGLLLDCNDVCEAGESCGGGVVANACGLGCVPFSSCVEALLAASLECGLVSNGCAGDMDCRWVCIAPASCGGGGVANACGEGCIPHADCGAALGVAGVECGVVDNGCAGSMDCTGVCAAPQSCGGAGVPEQCGESCVPYADCPTALAAAGLQCGLVSNGCAGSMDCTGACTPPQSCGGGGVANTCGSGCTPYADCAAAVAAAGVQCGVVSNGCAGNLDCTEICADWKSCEAGGVCVGHPPVITVQPQSTAVNSPTTAQFSVTATSKAPMTYLWSKNGSSLPTATGSTYTTPATSPSDDGASYRVVVSNLYGNALSDPAILKVIWHRLFVSGSTGVMVWDNPRSMSAARPAELTLGVNDPSGITESGQRLFVYSVTDGILVFDQALAPTLTASTAPDPKIPHSGFVPALANANTIQRLQARPPGGAEGLWAWGFESGAYYFGGPFSATSSSKALFTHPWQQTPSLLFRPASMTSIERLFMGQVSGAGLLAWFNPSSATGTPTHDFACTPTAIWSLAATRTRLFGGGNNGSPPSPGIAVWNGIDALSAARAPDFMLGSGGAGMPVFGNSDFVADLWSDGMTLAAAVQAGASSRVLVWTSADSAPASTAPNQTAALGNRLPRRIIGVGSNHYYVLTANEVIVLGPSSSGSGLAELFSLPGTDLRDLVLVY